MVKAKNPPLRAGAFGTSWSRGPSFVFFVFFVVKSGLFVLCGQPEFNHRAKIAKRRPGLKSCKSCPKWSLTGLTRFTGWEKKNQAETLRQKNAFAVRLMLSKLSSHPNDERTSQRRQKDE
ncbi:MAG: hypothetical protein ABSE16_21445 [Verrucomicrobiota bacterium]